MDRGVDLVIGTFRFMASLEIPNPQSRMSAKSWKFMVLAGSVYGTSSKMLRRFNYRVILP